LPALTTFGGRLIAADSVARGRNGGAGQAFHVQINARSEDDLDEEVLRKKIELSAGARY